MWVGIFISRACCGCVAVGSAQEHVFESAGKDVVFLVTLTFVFQIATYLSTGLTNVCS